MQTTSKQQATRGKIVKLPKSAKYFAANILNKEARRHYLNMMLDAVVTEAEMRSKKKVEKEEE